MIRKETKKMEKKTKKTLEEKMPGEEQNGNRCKKVKQDTPLF